MNPIVEIENLKKQYRQQQDQIKYLASLVDTMFSPTRTQYSEEEEDQFWEGL